MSELVSLLVFVIIIGLVIAWLRVIVKKAVVQPVRLDDGLLLDARLTEKTRAQVFWENNKAGISFAAGIIAGMITGVWIG